MQFSSSSFFRTDALPVSLASVIRSRDLARGDTLYRRGERAEAVFAVVYGRLQLFTSTPEGKKVPLYIVHAGECVSETSLFEEFYSCDVIAETDSRLQLFPKKALEAALRENPTLASEYMLLQARRCVALRRTLELRSLRSARDRIIQYLQTPGTNGGSIQLRLDRPLKNIADDLGLTHESFYRTLARLTEEGVVTRTRDTLSVRDTSTAHDPHPQEQFKAVAV